MTPAFSLISFLKSLLERDSPCLYIPENMHESMIPFLSSWSLCKFALWQFEDHLEYKERRQIFWSDMGLYSEEAEGNTQFAEMDTGEKRLNELGYKQELRREMVSSNFRIFPLSFPRSNCMKSCFSQKQNRLHFFFFFGGRLYSRLLQYHFPRWHFSLGSLLCMDQAFCMQDLQAWFGDGLWFRSSLGSSELQWLKSALLFRFVPVLSPYNFLCHLSFSFGIIFVVFGDNLW